MTRRYYPKKSQWAAAKAAALRAEADRLRAERIQSADWRGVRSKMGMLDTLGREARRFELLAERLASEEAPQQRRQEAVRPSL